MNSWEAIAASIARATGHPFARARATAAGGGSINQGYRLTDGSRAFHVKLNRPGLGAMFEAEAQGLAALAATGTIRVPRPVCWGDDGNASWLVLEHLSLHPGDDRAMAALGRALAALHARHGERFGWPRDNTIGSTLQRNGWSDHWVAFFRDQRLAFQLELARANGHALARGDTLLSHLDRLLGGHEPRPSLLHGDLWSGNAGFTDGDEPVIWDPACYYGDREADLAMTELFGGFGPAFHAAYREVAPLAPGYAVRRELYNLYHVLNHLNLFGGGYLRQAGSMIDRLLSEIR